MSIQIKAFSAPRRDSSCRCTIPERIWKISHNPNLPVLPAAIRADALSAPHRNRHIDILLRIPSSCNAKSTTRSSCSCCYLLRTTSTNRDRSHESLQSKKISGQEYENADGTHLPICFLKDLLKLRVSNSRHHCSPRRPASVISSLPAPPIGWAI